ncbi:MAG: metal-sulfur cluster assembly factor [Sulfolobales archaeon]|nr:metal-sulfur cluster assembly factor [Sulfolobales archaeon]MCX8199178.1 metal-sulfur cluster assembly factor [Sulfolobales archaeon]MDW8170158.1 metal-sulfur cluster assembly factor [Desulfurococcaceae archaeon]
MSTAEIKRKVVEVLERVADPEIGIDLYNLGMIYDVEVIDENSVKIKMSLTTALCPLANIIPIIVVDELKRKLGIDASIEIVYDPPWTPLRMTERGRRLFIERYGYDIVGDYIKRQKRTRNENSNED